MQILVMQPNTTAVFSFQMTQAQPYYGGQATCQFNTTVNYQVRCTESGHDGIPESMA